MGNITIFKCENLQLRLRRKNTMINKELYEYSKKNDILLIPLIKEYNLNNLYPILDQVESWNVFIIGNDKTYILAKTKHFRNEVNDQILNNKKYQGINVKFFNFLDKIWNLTLKGENIQIFVYAVKTLFLLNSYSFKNQNGNIIGAVCFLREAGLINEKIFQNTHNIDNKI
jgi:hypothetical protein